MVNSRITLALLASLLLLNGCSNNDNELAEGEIAPAEKTYVIFSPGTSELPIPNDLLFASEPLADGTMYAGEAGGNPVVAGIDFLDGNSVLTPIDIAFSAPLDDSQILDATSFIAIDGAVIPNPNQNVFLLPLSYPGGDALLQTSVNGTSVEIPTFADAVAFQTGVATQNIALLGELAVPTARAELISLDGGSNNIIRINPLKPLMPETKYLVVLANIQDAMGNAVSSSIAYDFIRDPESNLADTSLNGVRGAIQGWEQLASGYFGFMATVFEAASLPVEAPTAEDIIFTLTFTTGSTDSVLTSLAAPETFFEKSLRTGFKQDAIAKLVTGVYNVSGDNSAMTSVTDGAINSTINFLLTSPLLPDETPNALYNESIAGAVASGADFATIAADPTAAYIMQRAAAEAALSVHDSAAAELGDESPYVSISAQAMGTVQQLAAGAGAPVNAIFPVPAPRANSFYRVDLASDLNALLSAPALVYQGQIALPIYQPLPEGADGSNITSGNWIADTTIGFVIDAGLGNDAGTTPPSQMITHRYPFPAKQADVTIPLLAVLPEANTLASLGVTKPDAGWPVVINIPGITAERSTALPVADAMAFACINPETFAATGAPCFASITIDRPLHGIAAGGAFLSGLSSVTDPSVAIVPNIEGATVSESITERHYDFTADATANAVPMDYSAEFGSSGSLFINLLHFAGTRDSLRQMALDLLNLNASLATMDVDGDGEPDFDTSKVYVYGVSLGGIDAVNFTALNNQLAVLNSPFSSQPKIQAASVNVAGGNVTRLLVNSPSFAPTILGGLAAASEELVHGSSGLESYFNVFQGVVDSGDPANFASRLAKDGNSSVLFSQVAGDVVIPNAADAMWGEGYGPLQMVTEAGFMIDNFPSPLASTEPMLAIAGAIKTADAAYTGEPVRLVSRYTEGDHGSPASPAASAATFFEILQQSITFFALDGIVPGSIVTNPNVIEP
ncbi:MECDP-synthase [Teredinibacter purpureus]|uniref:MECDP-synthase n=1 Tax=Teredinibacter purpureus TaxID=2731756 RepID=UPI0005F8570F|nr:MECDP-synthase [Teredinibacter purpureus]